MTPKRTNDFQTLVTLIEAQLAPAGVSLTESKELLDRVSGKLREVDAVLEGRVGEHNVIVSIECTRTARPATIEWVEQMAAKHEYLPTSKLILLSRSGFTKNAIGAAQTRGIEVLTIEEASSTDWRILIRLESLVLHHQRLYPTSFGLRVHYLDEPLLRDLKVGQIVFLMPGHTPLRAATIVERSMADPVVRDSMPDDAGNARHWSRQFRVRFPPGTKISVPNAQPVPVEGFSFELRYTESETTLPLAYGSYSGKNVVFGTAKTTAGEVVTAMVEPTAGDPATFLIKILPGSGSGGRDLQIIKGRFHD